MSTSVNWFMKWYYFGDITTLLAGDCPQSAVPKPGYSALTEELVAVNSREELEAKYPQWPKKHPLLLYIILSIVSKPQNRSSERYRWAPDKYKNWPLKLYFKRNNPSGMIISKNEMILPWTPNLQRYIDVLGGSDVEEWSGDLPAPDRDGYLHVDTTMDAYEQVFVKNWTNKCKDFRREGGTSVERKNLLLEYINRQNSAFKFNDRFTVRMMDNSSQKHYSDDAAIHSLENPDSFVFEFGGHEVRSIIQGRDATRNCEEKDDSFTSEYPCGGF